MPDLSPLPGWSDWRALSNQDPGQARGTIDGTPCKGFQWYYSISEDLGTGNHHWIVQMQILAADGVTVLFESTLDLPISVVDLGPFGRLWYVQNEKITTTVPVGVETWENRTQQPILVYPAGYDGTGTVEFDVYTTGYMLRLPAGALFRVRHGEIGNTQLRFWPIETSVLAGGGRKLYMIDPVAGDEYLPRVENGMLTVRAVAHDGMTGRRSGLVVSVAGGTATATAGNAVIGWAEGTSPFSMTCMVPTSGTVYLFLRHDGNGGLRLVTGDGPQTTPAWCVGRVVNGRYAACDGVLVADGVEEAGAIGRREDGTIVVRYDTGAERDVAAVSRDRGVTWE